MAENFGISVILRLIDKASPEMQKFKKSMSAISGKMKSVGTTATMALTAPIVGFGVNAIRMGTEFQSTMNMVGAVTDTTGKQFENLMNVAEKFGRTTQFTARDTAGAMKFMGMAGFDANKIIAATPKVLQLAAAAQLDMASAADITTNIMAGWGFEAEEMTKVNDTLVAAFTKSNMSLPQLGASMRKVGPLAKALKVPFENVAAAVGILGNAGIQGEEAGTGLKTMLTRLINPSKKASEVMKYFELNFRDSSGAVKDITGIVKEFENAIAKGADETELTTAATEIFGQRGIQIISALVSQGSDQLDQLTKKLDAPGIAAKTSERQMEGLPGAMKLVTSAYEGLNLAFSRGKLGETVNTLGREFANFINSVTDYIKQNPEVVEFGLKLAAVFAIGGPLLIGIAAVTAAIGVLAGPAGVVVALGLAIAGIASQWEEGVLKPLRLVKQRWDEFMEFLGLKKTQSEISSVSTGAFRQIEADYVGKLQARQPIADATADAARRGWGAVGMASSQAEILIKVQSEEGTSAKIGDVKNKNTNLKVENKSSTGPTIEEITAFDFG